MRARRRGIGRVVRRRYGVGAQANPALVNPRLRDEGPMKGRYYICAFPRTSLTAATNGQNVTGTPQETFRAERFLIPRRIGSSLSISDLKVGSRPQFVSSTGVVPGELFAEDAPDVLIGADTAAPNTNIIWTLNNNSANAVNYECAALGPSLV